MEIRTYGIRHHGPGSARRLRAALEAWRPDLILLEAPADSTPALTQLVAKGMRPPLALVLYDAKNIERASFYPFARFSPEYQAIEWGAENNVEVRPIDLPAKNYLAQRDEQPLQLFPNQTEKQEPSPIPGKTRKQLTDQLRRDPLSLIAELAGFPDSESWWDATLERGTDKAEETFAGILEIVTDLRATFPEASDAENERREAFMRTEIRKALKSDAERIAVVVGAWHGPAVAAATSRKASTDRAVLKGLPRVKISQAWVPWSFPRLARAGGYGAGVASPAWYALRFDFPERAVDRWMASAAILLREADFDASPAMATEAVGLANTLATLRNHEIAGINELEEAVLGTLAAGRPERLELIREKLTVGTLVGFVPPGITTVPLLEDLRSEIKSTRMSKLWETGGEHYLKATKANPRGGIDLRQPNDLRKSHLLHRLNLLGMPWGKLQPAGPDTLSSFKEVWLLEWQPEFTLTVIERGSYGNTVARAAAAYARERAGDIRTVGPLATLTLDCLRAALPEVVPEMKCLLRARAAETTDVLALLAALPALVNTIRYGDSRKTDTSALLLVIEELLPRLAAGLAAAATNIDDERGDEFLKHLAAANYHLAQLDNETMDATWLSGLQRAAAATVHATVAGHCVRILYDRDQISESDAARRFSRALSAANGATAVANWIGGFLYGSGQLLLHYPPLFKLVDEWIASLVWEDFEAVVAQLRRTFANFSVYDRKRLMRMATEGVQVPEAPAAAEAAIIPKETEPTDPLVRALLDWTVEA